MNKRYPRSGNLFGKLTVLILAALLFLPGCLAAPKQGEPGGKAPAVISVWHSFQGAQTQILDTQVQKIMAAHPEVIIRTKSVPEEKFASLTFLAQAGGEGPDIFLTRREVLRQLYAEGALAPVVEFNSDAYAPAVAQFRFGGKLFAQPWLTDVPLLYYRTDMVKVPPASMADISANKNMALLSSLDTSTLAAWWNGQGGQLWANGKPVVTDPANQTFLEQILAWRNAKQLEVNPNALSLFAGGSAPYTIAWASQAQILTKLNVPWGSVPLNALTGGRPLPGPTWAVANSGIKTTGDMVPAIQTVEKALLSPEVEDAFVQAGYGMAAASSYYQGGFLNGNKDLLAQVSQSLAGAWALEGSAPEWKLFPLQDEAWASALAGSATAAGALAAAQAKAEELFAK